MKIATLNGATASLTNKEIEVSLHKLRFAFSGTLAQTAEVITPDAAAIIDSLVGDTKITIQKQDGSVTETLLQTLLLKEIAEISTHNDGVIKITRAYDAAVAANNTGLVEFTLEIANNAAYALDDNGKLLLNIDGKPANVVLDIDSLDYPVNGKSYIKYDNKFVNANVAKDFSIEQHYAMALPVANIVAVEMHYDNAKVVKLTKDEYKQLLFDSQDEVVLINGKVIYGYLRQGVMSIEHCWKVTITLDASTNIYFIKEQI